MHRIISSILIVLIFDLLSSYSQDSEIYWISVKYIPFSIHTVVDFTESDFDNISSSKGVTQVRNDSILDSDVVRRVTEKLQMLKWDTISGDKSFYDLRMQCIIIKNKIQIDTFYFDRIGRMIYRGKVIPIDESPKDLILDNICRPVYSYLISRESKYWPKDSPCCFDTSEFKEVFGYELYDEFKKNYLNNLKPR